MTYNLIRNGLVINNGLNRKQALMKLNDVASLAKSTGLYVTFSGRNDSCILQVSNGNTYEMRMI